MVFLIHTKKSIHEQLHLRTTESLPKSLNVRFLSLRHYFSYILFILNPNSTLSSTLLGFIAFVYAIAFSEDNKALKCKGDRIGSQFSNFLYKNYCFGSTAPRSFDLCICYIKSDYQFNFHLPFHFTYGPACSFSSLLARRSGYYALKNSLSVSLLCCPHQEVCDYNRLRLIELKVTESCSIEARIHFRHALPNT